MGLLKKLGLQADAVANGVEALQALSTISYDVALMDVQMPVMDGLEATRRIRDPHSSVLNHAIPVIALTAHAMRGDREKCLAAGMDGYLTKPVTAAALTEALEVWVTMDPSPRTPQEPRGPEAIGVGAAPEMEDAIGTEDAETEDAGTEVFDRAALVERLMGDADLAGEILAGFLDDIPRQMQALHASLAAGDRAAVEMQSHTIKGAASSINAEALRRAAQAMEEAAHSGDLSAAAGLMDQLRNSFARLQKGIDSCIAP